METQSGDKTLLFYPGGGEPWYIKDENRGVDQSHRMWPLYEEECLDLGEGAMCTGRRSHGCTCFGGWGWGTVLSIALLWTKVQRCPELGWPQGTVSHTVLLERKNQDIHMEDDQALWSPPMQCQRTPLDHGAALKVDEATSRLCVGTQTQNHLEGQYKGVFTSSPVRRKAVWQQGRRDLIRLRS